VSLIAAGDVTEYTADVRTQIRARFAEAAGVPPSGVSVQITAASVRIDVVVVGASVLPELGTPEAATSFLEGVQLAGGGHIEVERVEVKRVEERVEVKREEEDVDSSTTVAPIVAGSSTDVPVWLWCAVGALVLALVVVARWRQKSRRGTNVTISRTFETARLDSSPSLVEVGPLHPPRARVNPSVASSDAVDHRI